MKRFCLIIWRWLCRRRALTEPRDGSARKQKQQWYTNQQPDGSRRSPAQCKVGQQPAQPGDISKSDRSNSSRRFQRTPCSDRLEPTQLSQRSARSFSWRSTDDSARSKGLFRGLGTRMRTFVSRPIKEQTMMQFLRRVEQREIEADREELRLRELNRGAVPFPLDRVSRSLRRRNGINEVFADESFLECSTQLPTTSFAEEMAAFDRGGNQNEGAVVVNGSPFWVDPLSKLPTAPDTSDTEDDLPLNGGVIFEVHQGTIELVPMPEIPVYFDPLDDLSVLKRKDKHFFTKKILFGNSVRSMINLSDTTSLNMRRKKKRDGSPITFTEPTTRHMYYRESYSRFYEEPYQPSKELIPTPQVVLTKNLLNESDSSSSGRLRLGFRKAKVSLE